MDVSKITSIEQLKKDSPFCIYGERNMKQFGARLAELVSRESSSQSQRIIALQGELGAGKTTFSKGFVRFLTGKTATSPTFLVFRKYGMKRAFSSLYTTLFHADVYRVFEKMDLEQLGFGDILKNPKHVVLIEWAENIKEILPKDVLWVYFDHGKTSSYRTVLIK